MVAVEDDDSTSAFVLNSWVDERAHLDQVSVDPRAPAEDSAESS